MPQSFPKSLIEFDAFENVADYLVVTMNYWDAARQGKTVPHLSSIDPTALPKDALRWMAVFEVLHEERDFLVRLAGTGISSLTGREFTGMRVGEIPGSESGKERMLRSIDEKRPYYSGDPLKWSLGQEHIDYSALCLPYCDDDGTITRLMIIFKFYVD